MIKLSNVTKIYDNNARGVDDISLEVKDGDFAFIIGTTGSGKSTLVKLILKEIEPTSGELLINNINLAMISHKEIPYFRRNLGVVFQDFRLLSNKTVYENVAFAMQIVEANNRDIRRRVPAVLAMVGLQRKARSYPNQLSGGEKQRTALARAIVNNPPLILADEPTANLDPDTAWEIMGILEDINAQGTTVLVATHAKLIVNELQKRVITLKKGVIVRDVEKGGYSDED